MRFAELNPVFFASAYEDGGENDAPAEMSTQVYLSTAAMKQPRVVELLAKLSVARPKAPWIVPYEGIQLAGNIKAEFYYFDAALVSWKNPTEMELEIIESLVLWAAQ